MLLGGLNAATPWSPASFEPGVLHWLCRHLAGSRDPGRMGSRASEAAVEIAAACAAARLPLTDPVLARPPAEIEQWRQDSQQASAENQREAARTDFRETTASPDLSELNGGELMKTV